MKTLIMSIGEMDFSSIIEENADCDGMTHILWLSLYNNLELDTMCKMNRIEFNYILFGCFAVVMPVVVTNMLIGLATGNIDQIQRTSDDVLYNQRLPVILRGFTLGKKSLMSTSLFLSTISRP